MVSLLGAGSKTAPKKELIGEAGTQELALLKKEGEGGLAAYFKSGDRGALESLGKDGLPPLPSGASLKAGADKYKLTEENAYPAEYVFAIVCVGLRLTFSDTRAGLSNREDRDRNVHITLIDLHMLKFPACAHGDKTRVAVCIVSFLGLCLLSYSSIL